MTESGYHATLAAMSKKQHGYPFRKSDIIKAMNVRMNFFGRLADDPLLGIPITHDMIVWAQKP